MVAASEIAKRVTRTCYECGKAFDYEPLMALGREMFVRIRCDACDIIATDRQKPGGAAEGWVQKRERERRDSLEAGWKAICPPLYRSTDPKALQLPQEVLREVLGWAPQAKGIGLTGPSGTGKTRAVYLLLHRLHFEGRRVRAISAKEFEHLCHKMFEKNDDARSKLEEVRAVKVLFVDDVGKEKYTDRVESEFYNLIEHRSAHLLPILWTANASGTQLTRMLGEDRGAPIVRRLREFSTVFSC